MGFFSDLKDDLSQAVNELMPEEGTGEAVQNGGGKASSLEGADMAKPELELSEVSDMTVGEVSDISAGELDVDLDKLLDQVGDTSFQAEESEQAESPVEKKSGDTTPAYGKRISDEVSVLTKSMIINGNIATEGGLDVRGCIVGNVEALGKLNITGEIQGNSQGAEIYAEGARITGELRSQGSIKVGQNAVILGNIFANSAVIAGAVRGDLDIKGPVILDSSAIVMGDIKSKSVQINNGAVVEGMCSQCYAEVNPTSFFEELKKMK